MGLKIEIVHVSSKIDRDIVDVIREKVVVYQREL